MNIGAPPASSSGMICSRMLRVEVFVGLGDTVEHSLVHHGYFTSASVM